jgi:hypothetical protein
LGNSFSLVFFDQFNQGIIMNKLIKITLPLLLIFSANCYAEKSIVDVWQCKLKDNKTMKDAAALNEKWVKFMNANVEGGGINSYDMEPRVGNHDRFMFVDVYPNMQSWAAGENVMEKTEEGRALHKEFKELSKCSRNSLYSSTKH